MTYRLRSLAFGCAVAAFGSVLPAAAPLAQDSVPGMLRCFEGGVETATIGPIFRVWTAEDAAEEPVTGADGCHWRPMARIAMPGGAPPDQAMVAPTGRRIPMPRPAQTDAQNEAAALAAADGDVIDVPATPAAPPPLPPAEMASAAGSAAGSTAGTAPEAGDGVVVPPVDDRSARLPIDLAVAASLTAEAIAVESEALPPLAPPTAGPALAEGPGAGDDAGAAGSPDMPLRLDVALTLEAPDPAPTAITRSNPHPPAADAPRPRAADPWRALRPDPHPAEPVGPALLARVEGALMPDITAEPGRVMPALLAVALPAAPAFPPPPVPAVSGPADLPMPLAVATDPRRPSAARIAVAAAVGSDDLLTLGPKVQTVAAAPMLDDAMADALPEPRRIVAGSGPRANPHAGLPVPRVAPVVLAATTPAGHTPNPHAPLPAGWGAGETMPDPLIAAADMPLRGGTALTRWTATAGQAAGPALLPVTLPGWTGPAPRVVVATTPATVPADPPLPPVRPAELRIAAAEPPVDREAAAPAQADGPIKLQTARRIGPGDAEAAEPVDAPATDRAVVAVAASPAAAPDEPTAPAAAVDDGSIDATIAAVAAVRAPTADAIDRPAEPAEAIETVEAVEADAVAMPSPATAASAGPTADGWWLQLASLTSPEGAMREWQRRRAVAGDLLAALEPTVVRAEIPDRGTFYRLWIGPFGNAGSAGRLCDRIEARGEACFVHRLAGAPLPAEEVAALAE